MFVGFDKNRVGRVTEIMNKTGGGKFHVLSKDVFGFAEHQVNRTFGLGYKFVLKRNDDGQVLHRVAGADGRVSIVDIVGMYHITHLASKKFNIR